MPAFVIRLFATEPADCRLAGHVEVVETGETFVFRSGAHLLALLRRAREAEGERTGSGN